MMTRSWCSGMLALALWLGLAPVAQAQPAPTISSAAYTSSSITSAGQAEINRFAEHWIGQLSAQGAGDEQVAVARNRLIEPFSYPGATPAFLTAYSDTVGGRIGEAVRSPRPLVGMNALIVVARMRTGAAMGPLRDALGDANAGKRYWAARAAAELAGQRLAETAGQPPQPILPGEAQQLLLEVLRARLDQESVYPVVKQLLEALANLTVPGAEAEFFEVMNQRVGVHAPQPELPMEGERAALVQQYRRLIASNRPDVEARKQLARTAFRYLMLAAQQFDTGQISAEQRTDRYRLMNDADTILRWAVKEVNPGAAQPPPIRENLDRENWAAILLAGDRWRQILGGDPFAFSNLDLAFQAPER